MFITRASRHDRADVQEFLARQGVAAGQGEKGTVFYARDGAIVGCVRLVEVEPRIVVVADMVVDRSRRRQGIGSALMQAAMNSRGGTLYLRSPREHVAFFERFGFGEVPAQEPPPSVTGHLGTAPDEHEHPLLKAR